MAVINCPECSQQISSTSLSCPNCGYTSLVKRRGPLGKAMKYIFIWFNYGLFLFVIWTLFFAGSMAADGTDVGAAAAGITAITGIFGALMAWFWGGLFWGVMAYITRGREREKLTNSQVRRDKIIFWGGIALITIVFLFMMTAASMSSKSIAAQAKAKESWQEVPVIDSFGDTTSVEGYSKTIEGKYWDAISNNDDMKVAINLQDSMIAFSFSKYGDIPTTLLQEELIEVNIKDETGKISRPTLFMNDNMIIDTRGALYEIFNNGREPYTFSIDLSTVNEFMDDRFIFDLIVSDWPNSMVQESGSKMPKQQPVSVELPTTISPSVKEEDVEISESRVSSSKTVQSSKGKNQDNIPKKDIVSARPSPYRTIQFIASSPGKKFSNLSDLGQIVTENVPGKNLVRYKIGGNFSDSEIKEVIRNLTDRGFPGAYEN